MWQQKLVNEENYYKKESHLITFQPLFISSDSAHVPPELQSWKLYINVRKNSRMME